MKTMVGTNFIRKYIVVILFALPFRGNSQQITDTLIFNDSVLFVRNYIDSGEFHLYSDKEYSLSIDNEVANFIRNNEKFFIGVQMDDFKQVFGLPTYEIFGNGYAFEPSLMSNNGDYSGCWLEIYLFEERAIGGVELLCH